MNSYDEIYHLLYLFRVTVRIYQLGRNEVYVNIPPLCIGFRVSSV